MSASVRRAVTLLDNVTTQPSLAQFSFINGTDAVGDIVIVTVSQATGANTCATPTGWTLLSGPNTNGVGNLRSYVFAYKAVATDVDATPTTHDFQWTGGSRYTATAQVIRDSSAALSDIVVDFTQTTTASVTAPTVTVTAGDWVISYQVLARLASTSSPDITAPAGVTEGAESNTTNTSSPNYASSTNRKTTNVTSAGSAGGAAFTATAGSSHMQAYTLAIPTGNAPPTANAGADQTGKVAGATVTLSGSDSDSDGTVASRQWTQTGGTAVTLSGATTATATFTVPTVVADETLTFQYQVTDNAGAVSAPDTCTVGILAPVDDGGLRVYVVNGDGSLTELNVYVVNGDGSLTQLANVTP